ncbi:hypothetical protein ABVF61_13765 [Roseibium sp. HPY-6]|uniref:hypothetical protein n=1 Tax=Roseibium sp. HPY-6 TaxID=3229852 RepID=UPI00338DAD45
MTEITMNYTKIEWTYDRQSDSNNDTFNFKNLFTGNQEDDTEQSMLDFASDENVGKKGTDIGMEEVIIAHEHIERDHSVELPTFDDLIG